MRFISKTALLALMLSASSAAIAQTVSKYHFDIPAGTLSQSVGAIASQAGAAISFADKDEDALKRPIGPIQGDLTLASALNQALAGSGWYVAAAGGGQVRIAKDGGNSSEIIVTAASSPLRKEDSNLLTRADTPLRQTPGTVVSVTQGVLESQNTTTLEEAVRNLPGITFGEGFPAQIGSRGDSTRGISFTNGMRNSSLGGNAPTIDVESIEVLKGPSSVLTGTAVAGGLLNFVPKKAEGVSPTEISLGVGSQNYVRGSVDAGGAISASDRLYWRVVGLSEYATRLSEGGDGPRSSVAALMLGYRDHGWKIDTTTQYYDTKTVFGHLYYLDPTVDKLFPVSHLGAIDSPDNHFDTKSISQYYGIEKDILSSPDLSIRFRTRGQYQHINGASVSRFYEGTIVFPPPLNLFFGPKSLVSSSSEGEKSNTFSSSSDIYTKITTGKLEQQIIFAFDYTQEKTDSFITGDLETLPDVPPLLPVPRNSSEGSLQILERHEHGAVAQDQINWGRFHLLASIRKTWFKVSTISTATTSLGGSKTLPSGGAVFDLTKWASVYYTYQKGVGLPASSIPTFNGRPLPPELTTGNEAGVKADLFNNRLSFTADYFTFNVTDNAITDPLHSDFDITGPGQKGDGFEIAETGKITPTFFLEGGFVYTHNRNPDQPLVGQPKYAVNLWAMKTFHTRGNDHIDFGFGGNYQSAPLLLDANLITGDFTYPKMTKTYLRFDTALGYSFGREKLNLTVNNILNRTNFNSPTEDNNVYRDPGRVIRLVFSFNLPSAH